MKRTGRKPGVGLILFLLAFVLLWPAAAVSGYDRETFCPGMVWIDCARQERHNNGALTQYYRIRQGKHNALDYRVLYRFQIRSRPKKRLYGFDRFFPENGFFTAPVLRDKQGPYFTITSYGNHIADVYVVASCDETQYLAHVTHPLFGRAKARKRVQQNPGRLPKDLPQLRLDPECRVTYMQTGLPCRFRYIPKGAIAPTVSVWEDQRRVAELPVSDDGTFVHTPPHDPDLDRSGAHDFKQTVILARETVAGKNFVTTQTVLLHRSYIGHKRLGPGLILFCATALLCSLLAVFKRKCRWI